MIKFAAKKLTTHSIAKQFSAILALALISNAQAQLADGNYIFSNSQYTLQFAITESGWSINNTTLKNNSSGQVEKQTGGELMKHGPAVWYQFQTGLCNYSFDEPKNTLKLSRFDCKDKSIKEASIELTLPSKQTAVIQRPPDQNKEELGKELAFCAADHFLISFKVSEKDAAKAIDVADKSKYSALKLISEAEVNRIMSSEISYFKNLAATNQKRYISELSQRVRDCGDTISKFTQLNRR